MSDGVQLLIPQEILVRITLRELLDFSRRLGSGGFASCPGCTLSARGDLLRGRESGHGKRFRLAGQEGDGESDPTETSVTLTNSSSSQGDRGFSLKCWPQIALQAALRKVVLFMSDKNAPDEFGIVFQGATDNWQEKVTRKMAASSGAAHTRKGSAFAGSRYSPTTYLRRVCWKWALSSKDSGKSTVLSKQTDTEGRGSSSVLLTKICPRMVITWPQRNSTPEFFLPNTFNSLFLSFHEGCDIIHENLLLQKRMHLVASPMAS